jgi:hypothetical protein
VTLVCDNLNTHTKGADTVGEPPFIVLNTLL